MFTVVIDLDTDLDTDVEDFEVTPEGQYTLT